MSSLKVVDLDPLSSPAESGLVSLRPQYESPEQEPLELDEVVAVQEAQSIEGLDYIFFRRFGNGRSSQIAAYVIDNSDERFDKDALAKIHKNVWLNGSAPLLYIGWRTRVDILSCARGPDFWRTGQGGYQYLPAAEVPVVETGAISNVKTASEISEALELRNRFSALRLSDGTFWDEGINSDLADADQGAHRRLIEAVIEADDKLKGKENPVLRRLLLLTVLIKYLEDRGVFAEAGNWFAKFHEGAETFFDVLQQGTPEELRRLLSHLENKFNGDVFCLPEDGIENLTSTDLRNVFSTFVEGKTLRQQRYLWEAYSFQHLPVEVLSHLYQHFAQHDKGAIYTPPFVASLLLDFALPYNDITGSERILDPTCGSGIFLVSAFRRLVNHWRSRNQWSQPDVATLKAILKRSIFGVEIQEESLHLAAFSLALAVCDALKPNVIWNELQFDKLIDTNLIEGDFFDFVNEENLPFDVILGNPPFLSKLSDAGNRVNRKASLGRGKLPDTQIAYLVAEQSFRLLHDGGRLCLIQPAGLLYNEKSRDFQRYLLSSNRIDYVLDFVSVRGLFNRVGRKSSEEKQHTSDTKVIVLVATNVMPSADHVVGHLTFRRTFSVKERIGFELDHYDYHRVPLEYILVNPQAWKVNLLGGGRLHHLADRLNQMETLKCYVERQGWDLGEGYIVGDIEGRSVTSWLVGKPLLPSKALTEDGINEEKLSTVENEVFEGPRTQSRYEPPLMLIRENEKLHCGFWERGFLAYRDKIVGIHAPLDQRDALLEFFNKFRRTRPLLQALCLLQSTQLLVGRATAVIKRDIDNLPWSEDDSWNLASWEEILCTDLVEHMADYIRLGQDSRLLKEAANSSTLEEYAYYYQEMLGGVYENLKVGRAARLNSFICQSFYFGEEPLLEDWPDDWGEHLHKLIYTQWGQTIRTTRLVRFYESNVVIIIKPDKLRYWIPSTAVRDADETMADLIEQGY